MVQQVARLDERRARSIAWLALGAILFGLLTAVWAYHDRFGDPLIGTANHRLPSFAAPSAAPHFSHDPTDREFLADGSFEQPLVPIGPTSVAENRDLADAITSYDAAELRDGRDAVEPLTRFLQRHPNSAWRPALLVNLGSIYRATGHFSRAMAAFEGAWDSSKTLSGQNGRAIGDAAIGELTQFNAYLGRKERLAALLAEARGRPITGTAVEAINNSSLGLTLMTNEPGRSFRCGPLALERIVTAAHGDIPAATIDTLRRAKSTPYGLSLTAVAKIAASAGMHYQMAFRTPGAAIVTPAVAHWKMGHYAAIVGQSGDRYLVQDGTFGRDIRISSRTLDEEASGYFLIPEGPLPKGWRAVGSAEGAQVWGKGNTGANRDTSATGPNSGAPAYGSSPNADNGNPNGANLPDNANASNNQDDHNCGCTTWNVEPMPVSLSLHDRPVGYNVPYGPAVDIDLYYSQRDTQQPQTFNYINFGHKWTFTWLSYITDNRATDNTVALYQRGGGAETYSITGLSSAIGPYSQAFVTVSITGGATSFVRHLKNGSTETFGLTFGNKHFMTSVADPQGNKVSIAYDTQMRITSLTDAAGQVTTLSYGDSDPLHVTKITDPFGRAATFTYNGSGQLASITDAIGITSQYTYGAGDFIAALKTPYGTTQFGFGDVTTDASLGSTRFLNITDTLGRKSRVEFRQFAPGIPFSDPDGLPHGMAFGSTYNAPNTYMNNRNTFVWNPVQYAAATAAGGLDYTKAKILHFLHIQNDAVLSASRVIESIKEPLEKRIWFIYPDQPDPIFVGSSDTPIQIGRVLDNGSSQVRSFSYNMIGNVTSAIDPVGRRTTYSYDATGVDLLSVSNTTGSAQRLATLTYNGNHRPLAVVGANGATTSYEYNAAGQPTRITDALGNASTFAYSALGYLTSLQGPISNATYSFTRDSAGRIASATDPAGRVVTYTYDAIDRPIQAAFPDGTTAKFAYTLLDLTSTTDRLGRTTQLAYDSERQLASTTDPLGQITRFTYTGGGALASITDPNNHTTSTTRDIEDRVVAKIYADGTQQTVAYENSIARVHTTTDALGQVTAFAYNADDTPAAVTYTNAPKVSFTYDPAYQRPLSMIDGTGTTSYAYVPAGKLGANRLQAISSPIAGSGNALDTIAYTYDALDRVAKRTVNGVDQTTTYDALGRVATVTNAVDNFTYAYGDGTSRVSAISSTKGPKLDLAYYDGTGDELVKQMTYTAAGKTLSQFGYSFNANDNVTKFTQSYLGQQFAALLPGRGEAHGIGGGDWPNPVQWALAALPSAPGLGSAAKAWLPALLAIGGFIAASVAGVALAVRAARAATAMAHPAFQTTFGGRSAARRAWRAAALMPSAAAMTIVSACGHDGSSSTAPAAPMAAATAQVTTYQYDSADRLTSAAVGTDLKAAASPQYAYEYDAASNLTGITPNAAKKVLAYTATNAIASGTYDANGSPLTLDGASYSWDGANRLEKYVSGTAETDFVYDGLSRLVEIVEKTSGAVTADHAYTWCGQTRCLERDNRQSGSPVSKQYFEQGELQGTTALYYVTDRLGSVRQLVDASGAVQAQYEYDAYGNRTKVSGSKDSDFGFTGLFHHGASGLDFAVFRAYSTTTGRWINRDPIGEVGGLNLFQYVSNNPLKYVDRLGLQAEEERDPSEEDDPFTPPPAVFGMRDRSKTAEDMANGLGQALSKIQSRPLSDPQKPARPVCTAADPNAGINYNSLIENSLSDGFPPAYTE